MKREQIIKVKVPGGYSIKQVKITHDTEKFDTRPAQWEEITDFYLSQPQQGKLVEALEKIRKDAKEAAEKEHDYGMFISIYKIAEQALTEANKEESKEQ